MGLGFGSQQAAADVGGAQQADELAGAGAQHDEEDGEGEQQPEAPSIWAYAIRSAPLSTMATSAKPAALRPSS